MVDLFWGTGLKQVAANMNLGEHLNTAFKDRDLMKKVSCTYLALFYSMAFTVPCYMVFFIEHINA